MSRKKRSLNVYSKTLMVRVKPTGRKEWKEVRSLSVAKWTSKFFKIATHMEKAEYAAWVAAGKPRPKSSRQRHGPKGS